MKKAFMILVIFLLIITLYACTTESNNTPQETNATINTISSSNTIPTTETTNPASETTVPTQEPQETEPPVTDLPATEPPATDPPATEPPATEPPATTAPPTEGGTCSWAHHVGEFTVLVEPTITSPGLQVAYCEKCGKEFTYEIARLINPEKRENVDPRITIRENVADSLISYRYKTLGVIDARSWGGAPNMVITEEDYLDISYYTQDGTLVTYTLRPVEGYTNNFAILEDGSYNTGLWGDFKD